MSDNSVQLPSTLSSFRHIAVQRLLGMTDATLLDDVNGRSIPARVYPASGDADDGVVEPSAAETMSAVEFKTFTGRAAPLKALEYAHDTYDSVLYHSR